MLDIRFIRENAELIRADLKRRKEEGSLHLVDDFLKFEEEVRKLMGKAQELRQRRNQASQEVNKAKKEGKDIKKLVKEIKDIPQKIKDVEDKQLQIQAKLKLILNRIPNLLHESVPYGETDEDNKVIKEYGKISKFSFTPKSHIDIMEEHDLADFENASKISGTRFYYLKNELAMLEYALIKYSLDFLHSNGFTIVQPPYLMRGEPYAGVTDLEFFKEQLYKIENEDLYLIATSEHPLAAMHMNTTFESDDLPKLYAGISPSFRKEAGTHGKDEKGIFRVHHFNKVEQFIFCQPEDSWKFHETLLEYAVDLWKKLEIPFRVVNVCTGDIGIVAAKKYDMEAWMPAQNKYREIVSCSNCTAYQATSLNIKLKKGDEKISVHTLNSTLIATTRAIVAILENYQDEKGRVRIPKVLVPYMNGIKRINSFRGKK